MASGLKPWEIGRFTIYELNLWIEAANIHKMEASEALDRQAYNIAAISRFPKDEALPDFDEIFHPEPEMTDEELAAECAAKGLRPPDG